MFAGKGLIGKLVLLLMAFLVFGVVSFCVSRFYIQKTDAYEVALRWLRESVPLTDASGSIQSMSMSWTDEASIDELEINGRQSGEATFTVLVVGTTAAIPVTLKLNQTGAGWKVASAVAGTGPSQRSLCLQTGC